MKEEYAGCNDSHLADLLAEREGITIARSSLQRLLRGAGLASTRKRRAPKHRSRRDRMPREGLLLQTDGSRHDWLEGRGPWLTLVGYIDDATGCVTGATFRDQEDSAGYLEALMTTIGHYGVTGAIYHDRHTIFEPPGSEPLTLEEQLVDARAPTQLGRTFAELGIGSVKARSPQAKGRIERLWGTLQDRLVAELRIAGIDDRDGATTLQLPAKPNGRSRAGQQVELHVLLDGRMLVWDGQHELRATPAPLDAVQLRALAHARVEVGEMPRSAATATTYKPDHPWRRVKPGTKLHAMITAEQEGRTDSLSS